MLHIPRPSGDAEFKVSSASPNQSLSSPALTAGISDSCLNTGMMDTSLGKKGCSSAMPAPETLAPIDARAKPLGSRLRSWIRDKLTSSALDIYFDTKSFEQSGLLYERIGVPHFGRWLKENVPQRIPEDTGLMRPANYRTNNYYLAQNPTELRKFVNWTRYNEFVHGALAGTFALGAFAALSASNFTYGTGITPGLIGAAIGCGFNVIPNLYCVFLQRYNRARIADLEPRLKERQIRHSLSDT